MLFWCIAADTLFMKEGSMIHCEKDAFEESAFNIIYCNKDEPL
jgi:hypothetical protein